MKPQIKITRSLHIRILDDLSRPHSFAWERVGFILCNHRNSDQTKLVVYDYIPISDEHYLNDPECGARFGGEAIRLGMALALEHKCCVLHVHAHQFGVLPSGIDRKELPGVAQSIRNVCPRKTHGWLILSNEKAYGQLITPNGEVQELMDLSVVGFPMVMQSQSVKADLQDISLNDNEENRQGFLGANFDNVISDAKIGIVGLGGGGSHIVQQLAHIGFLNFLLCDKDIVEESNLNRLVGTTKTDVLNKEYKSNIARRVIENLQPDAIVDCDPDWWEAKKESLAECDLVFGCVDSFSGRCDLEAFCRRNLIPLIDIGMDVKRCEPGYEIYGQVALSLPGKACLKCLGVLSDTSLEEEAADYGDAGPKPQVVWPNGILASSAIGLGVSLISNWSQADELPLRLDYTGSTGVVSPPPTAPYFQGIDCPHYKLKQTGIAKYTDV